MNAVVDSENKTAVKKKYRHMVGKQPDEVALEDYDMSQRELFQNMTFPGFFERLRNEDPVHYCKDSKFGPYWSITKFQDIMEVEGNPEAFSSEPSIAIMDLGDDIPKTPMFIAMDEPKHSEQRRTVQGVVAPKNLKEMEAIIRERVQNILDPLPLNEEFDWVDKVSIELTGQMLATILGFPFEERRKLTYWSDVATAVPGPESPVDSYEDTARILMNETVPAFMELWQERKENPGDFDIISLLAHGENTKNMASENPLEFLVT